jgi:antitoxin YefM
MNVLGFSEVRARLRAVFEAVVADHDPVVVVRRGAEAVVLVSLADWRARESSQHLFSNPVNARRLIQAVRELDAAGEP